MQVIKPTFDDTVVRLRNARNDTERLGEICLLFQACRTIDEVCGVAKDWFRRQFPNISGSLSLFCDSRDFLETVITWGKIQPQEKCFHPTDCWAMRRGRSHQVEADREEGSIACHHYDADSAEWHLCLPLMASGEVLGVLYFCGTQENKGSNDANESASDCRSRFLTNISESVSLAIANLRFQETIQHQAIRDPLTKLFNRRYLEETLHREMHQATRAHEMLTFAILDVDHFKQFNDSYGHDAGDALLRAVGDVLTEQMRGGDIACRYGGEEFVLVYPGMCADVASRRLEIIRQQIGAISISHRGQSCEPVTISAGIAVYPDHALDTDCLINAADQALYGSKNTGRNRVTIATNLRSKKEASPLKYVHDCDPIHSESIDAERRGDIMDIADYL